MILKTIFALIRALLFTEVCVVCGQEGALVHSGCVGELSPAPPHRFPWITSLWSYRDKRVKTLIKKIKKHPLRNLVEELLPAQKLARLLEPSPNYLLVPIPASRHRLRNEGFNQAEAIARIVAQRLGSAEVLCALTSTHTQRIKQAHITNRADRMANRKGAYLVDPVLGKEVCGKDIVLIDDVTTTGATLLEARRLLLDAGARKVTAFVLAH